MFTYIKLKNFLSFGDVIFDFKKSAQTVKTFIAIYGENGSGKSNFVKSIEFLCRTLISRADASKSDKLSDFLKSIKSEAPTEIIERLLREDDIGHYILSCRTLDCDAPTEVEYGFMLNGREGVYRLAFTDHFTGESLYYFTGKQRGYLYKLSIDDNERISSKYWSELFPNKKAKEEINDEVDKYWGKHTFLSILVQIMNERNSTYISESISEYLTDVVGSFFRTTVISKTSNVSNTVIQNHKPDNVLKNLSTGKIAVSQLPLLERSERILRDFFTQTYADIKDVSYEKVYTDNENIRYQLFVEKMISGKVRRISIENESSGTQQILNIVRMLLGLFCGVTVIYDEIDNGIHDVLLNNILTSLIDDINGQLIITTHNTMLLEEIEPHSAYVINVDYRGNKSIKCVADFPIQNTNNARNKYLKGLFGGIPYSEGIDYDFIVNELALGEEDD